MNVPAEKRDWVSNRGSYALAWGLPTAALIIAIFLPPPAKTFVWSLSLIWMGIACVANALRCGRRHCYLTGPFFLLMAVAVLLHGTGIVSLGERGWLWLGATIAFGGYGLFCLPDYIWGKYARMRNETGDRL